MKARLAAFLHAFRGGWTLLKTQPHAKAHAAATLVVLAFGFWLNVTAAEWTALVIVMTMVWLAEALNTAIEFLADEVTLEWKERIKHAKDIAAFAVLTVATGAAIVGGVIFLPKLWALLA